MRDARPHPHPPPRGVQVFANYPVAAAAAPAAPAADPAAKVTSLSVAPFSAVRVAAPDWSPLGLAAGVLLVAVAAASTVSRRRYLLER